LAHMMKMTRTAVGHMFNHYGRSDDLEKAAYVIRSNENINSVNTVLNYNLARNDQPLGQLEFLNKRLSEVRVQNRSDVNVMVDWVVTLPQTLNNQGFTDEEKFFREAYAFLSERYGKENVISAYVHLDETTPHLHFAFVPVTEDTKRGGFKLSAKEVVNRQDLRTFHKNLSDHMERVFGRDIGILNEATKEGNKSIQELKRQSAAERLQSAMLEASRIVSKAQDDVKPIEEHKRVLQGEIEGLQRDLLTTQQVKDVPHSKTLIGDKQVISTADFEVLCKTAATAEALLEEIVPARKVNARAKEIISQAEEKASVILARAKRESLKTVIDRERKVSDLENKLQRANNCLQVALSLLSETARQEFVSAWDRAKNLNQEHMKNAPDWER